MRFNINEYNKIKYLKTEQINKMSLQELLPIANRAIKFAKNRQDRMLKYMERNDIETTPAMRSPEIQHKQPKSKLGRQEGEFKGFQTYDFELKNNMKENLGYVRYKLNTAIIFLKSSTSTRVPGKNSVSPLFSIRTFLSICRTITSICLSEISTPCRRYTL